MSGASGATNGATSPVPRAPPRPKVRVSNQSPKRASAAKDASGCSAHEPRSSPLLCLLRVRGRCLAAGGAGLAARRLLRLGPGYSARAHAGARRGCAGHGARRRTCSSPRSALVSARLCFSPLAWLPAGRTAAAAPGCAGQAAQARGRAAARRRLRAVRYGQGQGTLLRRRGWVAARR